MAAMGDSRGGFGGGKKVLETEEFQEEEVWAMTRGSNSKTRKNFARGSSSAWSIQETTAKSGGAATERVARHQSSAPMNIPERSKILKRRSKKNDGDGDGDDDDDDDDDEMAPPHEYLARRVANTRIASYSMCEGVGRTLKGRDLRKTRNDILTKTGFIE